MNNIKNAIIVGLGKSGLSAAEFLLQKGYSVVGFDDVIDNNKFKQEIVRLQNLGLKVKKELDTFDFVDKPLVIISPGIPPTHRAIVLAKKHHSEILGEVELACRYLNNHFCIGITGTNGKTTVTLLIEHILKECGIKAKAVGNVGLPLTSQLSTKTLSDVDVFVIELSSFQLESMMTPVLNIGLLLNITPDHLDRYPSMEAYMMAKFKIAQILKTNGICYINEQLEEKMQKVFPTFPLKFFGFNKRNYLYTDGMTFYKNGSQYGSVPSKYKLKKTHDLENILAAFSICNHFEINPECFSQAIESFQKPQHRIEFVRCLEGVSYYNDSKGTNVDAVIKAVKSLEGEILLIAGGVDKGFDYFEWLNVFPRKVKAVYVIGEAARKIELQLKNHVPVEIAEDLDKAVAMARKNASPGNHVLLSPGCASYDMFLDYEHRGHEFKRIVNALIGKE